MEFVENQLPVRIGTVLGFCLSLSLFAVILFFVLKLTGRLPSHWTVLYTGAIGATAAGIGAILRKVLG